MTPSSVAENSSVWCLRSMWRRIHSTWGRKPMSAMRSASSSDDVGDGRRASSALRSSRSMRRPGVATTISAPSSSAATCLLMRGAAVDRWPARLPEALAERRPARRGPGWPAPGWARARGRRGLGLGDGASWSRGRPNARVLPEPVLALPATSRPARASAMVSAWMGNGRWMPWSARAAASSGSTPSSSKVGCVMKVERDATCGGPPGRSPLES